MTHWHITTCKSAAQRWKALDTMSPISSGDSALTDKRSCWRSMRTVQAPTRTRIFINIKMDNSLKSAVLTLISAGAIFPPTALSQAQSSKKSCRPTGLLCAGSLVQTDCWKKFRRTYMILRAETGCSYMMRCPCTLLSELTTLLP